MTCLGGLAFSAQSDCFYMYREGERPVREWLDPDDGIGMWRVSEREGFTLFCKELKVHQVGDIKAYPLSIRILPVSSERDADKLWNLFEKHRRLLVRAEYGGCGKSYACKAMT